MSVRGRNAWYEIKALHKPFIRKRQRAAALQDASEGHVLPAFRQVLDCASPLALWLPPQKWVNGPDARLSWRLRLSMNLKVVSLISNGLRNSGSWSQCVLEKGWRLSMNQQRAAGILPAEEARFCRRDVGSTLLGRTSRFTMVHGSDARPILEVEALRKCVT